MTHNCKSEISCDQLTGIATFIVAADEQLTITWASEPVLRRVENALGLKVSDIVKPIEPSEEMSLSSIARNMRRQYPILLKSGYRSTPLIGQWVTSRGGFILLATPNIKKQEDLDKFSLDDFPENDLIVELLTSHEEYIMSLKEARVVSDNLRESEELYRTLYEGSSNAVMLLDDKGFIDCNPATLTIFGCVSKEEFCGKHPSELSPPHQPCGTDSMALASEHIRKAMEWRTHRFEWIHQKMDGTQFPCEVLLNSIELQGGMVLQAVVQDLTEHKREEEERQALEQEINQARKLEAVGSLSAGIAHEINTPIQFVGDNTSFLSDSFQALISLVEKNDELWQEASAGGDVASLVSRRLKVAEDADIEYLKEEIPIAIEQTLEGVQRVSKIVRAMKNFAHSDQGVKSLSNINDMLESTLTVAQNELKYVANTEIDFDMELPDIECYCDDLNQVFLNLLVNAAHTIADVVGDASAGKGIITVTTARENEDVVIRIADTGKGIPPSIQGRIFDPFFTTKDVGKGTGQGLSIARKIVVDKHNGSLDFETEEGKGTTFIIRLPISVSNHGDTDRERGAPVEREETNSVC